MEVRKMVGVYKNNEKHLVWNFYYSNGNRIARIVFDNGEVKKYKSLA